MDTTHTMHLIRLLTLLTLAACSSTVKRDFQATWDEVMSAAPPTSGPDLSIRVADESVQRALNVAISSARLEADLDLGGTRFEPAIVASALELEPPACAGCLSLDGEVTARIGWTVLSRAAGRIDTSIGLAIDARPSLKSFRGGQGLFLDLVGIRRFSMQLDTRQPYIANLGEGPIKTWLSGALEKVIPDIRIARFGTTVLPVQPIDLVASEQGLQLNLLTGSPTPTGVGVAPETRSGWAARLSVASLIGIVRREAFAQGELSYGTWADPRDISVEDGEFVLDLRLWRTKGGGWWRDYEIRGPLTLDNGRITLEAEEVIEIASSPNAALADPIAALAKRRILKTLQDALHASVPASHTQDLGPIRSAWSIGSVEREGDDLLVRGKVTFKAAR